MKSNEKLSLDDLRERGITYSRAQLYRLMAAGDFPKPVRLGGRSNTWLAPDVDAWLAKRTRQHEEAA